MKINSFVLSLMANFFVVHGAYADNFSVQTDSPSIENSSGLQRYVDTISHYKPETAALTERLQNTIDYYRKVHVLKTVEKKQYTVDCIPFAEQPALIDAPQLAQRLLPMVKKNLAENIKSLQEMNSYFDFNPAKECPLGSVAILRPSKTILTSKLANKKEINRLSPSLTAGYSWQQGVTPTGETINIPTQASQAYFKGPQLQQISPTGTGDHSLDQFWLSNDPQAGGNTYTVEFGILSSAYFTYPNASTSIFVFASVDNYGSKSCYNLGCPNFIQLPNTPPLGTALSNTNADYIFRVKHETPQNSEPGYYLTLVTYDSTTTDPHRVKSLLGYYPESLYNSADLPGYFSAGAEVYASAAGNGTTMYGNYRHPYYEYNGPKQIGLITENANNFPYYASTGPDGIIWHYGQSQSETKS